MSRPEPKLTFAKSKRGLGHVERADNANVTLCGKDSSTYVPLSVDSYRRLRYIGGYCWPCHCAAKACTAQHPAIEP